MRIDANGMPYRQLNQIIRDAAAGGEKEFELLNVNGQRYIGDGLEKKARIEVHGVPGNDLGAFMNGPQIIVRGNAQDGIANTMNDGKIVVHGDAGDVLGYGMRGGKLHVLGEVGYRVGIHMKSYKRQVPVIIAGGIARDFFGEYMAGGVLILLGLNRSNGDPIVGDYVGTGMHGGVIYVRGAVDKFMLGKEVGVKEPTPEDRRELEGYLKEFCDDFGLDLSEIMSEEFTKLVPMSHRPYGNLYAY
jgi:glutamate synthase domain-containing protein 3